MARGKYADRSAASTARDAALRESAALRAENRRMAAEIVECRQALNDTLEAMHSETARLRGLVVSGQSERESELREQLAQARAELQDARRTVGLEVTAVYQRYSVMVPGDPDGLAALIAALGVTAAEFFSDAWSGNRRDRRLTKTQIRRNWDLARQDGMTR